MCLFAHENDEEEFVDTEVSEVRYRIFSELSRGEFSVLPEAPEVLYEIGEIVTTSPAMPRMLIGATGA